MFVKYTPGSIDISDMDSLQFKSCESGFRLLTKWDELTDITGVSVMVFNAAFSNNSVTSLLSVLLVEETGRKQPTCRKSQTNLII